MINLLPPQYQAELKQEENWKTVLILEIVFLIFLVSLILILFSIKIYLQGQVESLKVLVDLEEKTLQTFGISDWREKITLTNQKILKLETFYKTQVRATKILEEIFQVLPSEISLTALSWQKNISQVTLAGFSPSREILFGFKKNLEEKKDFSQIYFPPSNWIKPVDIDFQVSFKITK
jgi:Tfp pilus assembly protein PilN